MKKICLISIVFALLLGACGNTVSESDPSKADNPSIIQTSTNYQQEASKQAKELIADQHEFNEIIAVNSEDLIIIGVDPKHHDRFRLKELQKSLKDTVESSLTSHDIELSTDQKIILELRKLQGKITERTLSKEQLSKEVERIRKLSKEQT